VLKCVVTAHHHQIIVSDLSGFQCKVPSMIIKKPIAGKGIIEGKIDRCYNMVSF
jgi:hypothetical protein